MSTPTIDYDALAAQHGGTAHVDYDALAAQHGGSVGPNLTDNTKGEGLYTMLNGSGAQIKVPYSKVTTAQGQGYHLGGDAQQFARDQAADPNRRGGTSLNMSSGLSPQEAQARAQQIEAGMSAPMQVVAGVAKGGGTLAMPFLHAVAASTGGNPQDVSGMLEAHGGLQTAAKVGTIGAAILPAAVAAPVATAGGLVGGTVGAGAGQVIGDMAGASDNTKALLSDAGGIIGGGLGAKLAPNTAAALKAYLRPTPSLSVVSRSEMAARNLSAAVLPANKDASNFIKAAQEEVPNVLDYAKQTGNPLNTQLEFSKAAQGYAQHIRGIYENDVLGPVAGKIVKTTGTGFGDRMQEGPDTFSTLAEIDKRIVALNKQLDAPSLNSDDARRALATKTEMQNEVRSLTKILHDNLSEASGLAPEQVANLRQRVGRSYELANDTNAAVTARMQGEGKTDMGPIHLNQIPSRAVEFVRGGPVAIADRAFQRAISNFPGQASAVPSINPPAPVAPPPMRPSLSQAAGIDAEPNPISATPMSAEDVRAQVAKLNRSLARREISTGNTAAAKKAAEDAANARLEQLLSLARSQQSAARNGRR